MLAMVAKFESDLIRLRTREGVQVARAKGRLKGKQPKLKPNQTKHLVKPYDLGTYSRAELAELFGSGSQRSTALLNGPGLDCLALSNPSPSFPTANQSAGSGGLRQRQRAGCRRAVGSRPFGWKLTVVLGARGSWYSRQRVEGCWWKADAEEVLAP